MTAYAASVALKDPDGIEDIPLSRYRPDDPGTLTISIINDDGTAFEVSIKDGLATTTGPRQPTVGEQGLANALTVGRQLLPGMRPAHQLEQYLYTWAHGEPPPPPRT